MLLFGSEGRAKNVWESPMGCLLFSFTLQMEDGRKLPLLQYVVSLAVTEAIKELCQTNVSSFILIITRPLCLLVIVSFGLVFRSFQM